MNLLNKKNIIIVVSIVAVAGIGTYFYQQSCEQKEQTAKTELYQVQKTLESEAMALSESEKSPGSKFDVDSKFSKSVAALNQLISGKASSRSKYEAAMKLGSMYMEYAQDASLPKAIDAFKKMTETANTSFQKSTAFYLLGTAYERANSVKEATEAFQTALKQGYDGMKGELLLSLVRISMKANDAAQAKKFSDQLSKEAPGTRAAQEAQKLVSKT